MNTDKGLVIGFVVLFIVVACAPCINANTSKISVEDNLTVENLGDNYENFDCLIAGVTTYTKFIKPIWPIFIIVNGTITFGREWWDYGGGSGEYYREPASGSVWTKGSNGVVKWNGDSLWGALGTYYYTYGVGPSWNWGEVWCYKGATGFTGVIIRGLSKDRFFGSASHVAIITEFPGR